MKNKARSSAPKMAGKKKTMEMLRETWKPYLEKSGNQDLNYTDAVPKRKAKWPHDSKELLFGSINYKGKYIGTKPVDSPDGKETVRKALTALIKETKHQSKFPEVDIAISVRSIIVTEMKTSMHICKNKLQRISFCTEEKVMGNDYFCFIVKKMEGQHACYCLIPQCPPFKINLTVGQAFELAYERFQQAKDVSDMFVTEMKKIKARKGKEDYVRRLEAMHKRTSFEGEMPSRTSLKGMHKQFSLDESPTLNGSATPDMNYAKQVRKLSQHLSDTLQPLRDDDDGPVLDLAMISSPDNQHFDSVMESINSEFREWDGVRSPVQPADVQDALKELDSFLIPLDSNSLTKLPPKPPMNDSHTSSSDEEVTFL